MILSVLAIMGLLASTASAVEIHQHTTIDNGFGPTIDVVRVIDVAPSDKDDDGCADTKDDYNGPGCDAPVVYSPGPQSPTATPTSTTTPDYSSSGYSIPAYIVECESGGDYSAVNPSGAGGAYQIMPSTWAGLGYSGLPQDAPPAVQDEAAAKLYAEQGAAPWVCG